MMALLASPTSPSEALLVRGGSQHQPAEAPDPDDKVAGVKGGDRREAAASLEQTVRCAPAAEQPGARITQHFQAIHKLVDGPPGSAPIEQDAAAIGRVQKRLAGMGGGLGKTDVLTGSSQDQAGAIESCASWPCSCPRPVSALVAQIGTRARRRRALRPGRSLRDATRPKSSRRAANSWRGAIPSFGRGPDLALADFATMFAPAGVFDTFFSNRLDPLVDTSTNPWHWKEGAGGIGSNVPLAQFQAAERIRQVYFPPGSPVPAGALQPHPRISRSRRGSQGPAARARCRRPDGPVPLRSVRERSCSCGRARRPARPRCCSRRAAEGPSRSYQGPWAFFHLLDDASIQPQSDVRYRGDVHGRHITTLAVTLEAAFGAQSVRSQ